VTTVLPDPTLAQPSSIRTLPATRYRLQPVHAFLVIRELKRVASYHDDNGVGPGPYSDVSKRVWCPNWRWIPRPFSHGCSFSLLTTAARSDHTSVARLMILGLTISMR
jgi:hypothetical protein